MRRLKKLIRRLFDKFRKQDKEKPLNLDCAIIQLPVDIILHISEHLPAQSQLLLAQTCRSLRSILYHQLSDASAEMDRREHVEYLSLLPRDIPDQWACQPCVKLHQIDTFDTPTNQRSAGCKNTYSNIFGWHSFLLRHRHIQLTLKYARLGDPKYQTYLSRLLEPHHASFSPRHNGGNVIKGKYSVYPKVVDGRYLLLSTWTYQKDVELVSRNVMGTLRICKHQCLYEFRWPADIQAIIDKTAAKRPLVPKKTLVSAVDHAFAAKNVEIRGCCPCCPTDFSVQASPKCVVIRVWQDFGGEGSPLDLAWRVYGYGGRELTLSYPPGTVRKRYGTCKVEARLARESEKKPVKRPAEKPETNQDNDNMDFFLATMSYTIPFMAVCNGV